MLFPPFHQQRGGGASGALPQFIFLLYFPLSVQIEYQYTEAILIVYSVCPALFLLRTRLCTKPPHNIALPYGFVPSEVLMFVVVVVIATK